MESAKFNTYFKITGDFLSGNITEIIGIKPSKSQSIKNYSQRGNIKYFSLLVYEFCNYKNLEIDEQLLTTIKPFISKINILMKISLPKNVADFCEQTGTEFNIDPPICFTD